MNRLTLENDKSKRLMGSIVVTIFVLLLIPLLLIGRYNYPSADDFSYGLHTAQIWAETHSLAETLAAAVQQVQGAYTTWQGTFSAVFLMALQPAVFGENMYVWTSVILLFSLTIGTSLFLKVILMEYLGAGFWDWIIISGIILMAMIQFVYSPVEGFYWYNGGIYYTFFYSLSLCFFSCVLSYLKSKTVLGQVFYVVFSVLLGVALGGGNYTTALNVVIVVALLTIFLVTQKDKRVLVVAVILIFCMLSLLFSMMAPGNAIRQEAVGQPNAVKAIILSFIYGGYSILNFTTIPILLTWLFLLPYIYHIVKKLSFSFRYPLVVIGLSFCVYCAQATPPFYAMGLNLPERLINIIYYSFHILVLINLFYIVGWLSQKINQWKAQCTEEQITAVKLLENKICHYRGSARVFLVVLILFSSIGLCTVTKGDDGKADFHRLPTTVNAAISLVTGEAVQYHNEINQRICEYQDKSQRNITVKEYSVKPNVIYYSDVTTDPSDWRNRVIAEFYNKKSVKLKSSSE